MTYSLPLPIIEQIISYLTPGVFFNMQQTSWVIKEICQLYIPSLRQLWADQYRIHEDRLQETHEQKKSWYSIRQLKINPLPNVSGHSYDVIDSSQSSLLVAVRDTFEEEIKMERVRILPENCINSRTMRIPMSGTCGGYLLFNYKASGRRDLELLIIVEPSYNPSIIFTNSINYVLKMLLVRDNKPVELQTLRFDLPDLIPRMKITYHQQSQRIIVQDDSTMNALCEFAIRNGSGDAYPSLEAAMSEDSGALPEITDASLVIQHLGLRITTTHQLLDTTGMFEPFQLPVLAGSKWTPHLACIRLTDRIEIGSNADPVRKRSSELSCVQTFDAHHF